MLQLNLDDLETLMEKLTAYGDFMIQFYNNVLPKKDFQNHVFKAGKCLNYLLHNFHNYSPNIVVNDFPLEFKYRPPQNYRQIMIPIFLDGHNSAFQAEEFLFTPQYDGFGGKYFYNFNLESVSDLWDYTQTLRYAIGAVMISDNYEKNMTEKNLKYSILAKVAYKCQTGILDDIIDKGDYDYEEAKNLYSLVLPSMISSDFDPRSFQKELNSILNKEQLQLSSLITGLCTNFNELFFKSINYERYLPYMMELDRNVTEGQALTVYQKSKYFDLKKMIEASTKFNGPDTDLLWYDKLANYVSGGMRYNLIDLAFTNRDYEIANFEDFWKGWYYFDIVIVYLNNIVNVIKDYKDGIYNLSLIDITGPVDAFEPSESLTIDQEDYLRHLQKNITFLRRGIKSVLKGYDDEDLYYPFITFMIPIVMMAEWIKKKDDLMIHFIKEMARHYPT